MLPDVADVDFPAVTFDLHHNRDFAIVYAGAVDDDSGMVVVIVDAGLSFHSNTIKSDVGNSMYH